MKSHLLASAHSSAICFINMHTVAIFQKHKHVATALRLQTESQYQSQSAHLFDFFKYKHKGMSMSNPKRRSYSICNYRLLCTVAKKVSGGKFADSLNLPKMPYALSVFKPDGRCNEREKYIKKVADFDGLYDWQQKYNKKSLFTIHDGPPYANGLPHVGHALNKIIKDVINRYKVLQGHRVSFIPGWDCHGLPIETKARVEKDFSQTDIQVRKQAHRFSRETLEMQRSEFKDWGVMADWEKPYITSDKHFVEKELKVFQTLYDKGLIYQDYMPVYWSPSSRTALAEAELEYSENHKSLSVYVKLRLNVLPDCVRTFVSSEKSPVNLAIWTTTPWTLPANQAVCYSPDLQYSLVQREGSEEYLIVAEGLVELLAVKLKTTFNTLSTFGGDQLHSLTYKHPIYADKDCPVLPADHVTADVGTGLVHTAPAHGHDDFKVALQHDLSKSCHVDEQGCYTEQAGELFGGKHVFDEGNNLVVEILGDNLIHSEDYIHKYPYDWRSKQPVIIRASKQWFIDTKSLKDGALLALKDVTVRPSVYKASLCDTISVRPYWCISRQRAWGVPIPAFQDHNGTAYVHSVITEHVRSLIAEHGADIWWEASDDVILPEHIKSQAGLPADVMLTRCSDILDIWFDSGITWSTVLGSAQADLYIEGVDQIRGWFQSSLLTCVALNGYAPYKGLMMHGFTVDESGRKMSKSVGNVVAPSDVIYGAKKGSEAYGIDVLRWWAASKYSVTNVDIGPAIIKQSNDKMLLLRKRMRFILGNLYDFIPEDSIIDYEELLPQDQYFLHLLYQYGDKVTKFYEKNEMSSVLNELELFLTKFSNLYATLSKDRLYCFPTDNLDRRSAQTVLHHAVDILVKSFAPILPFFSEDCYFHRHGNQLNKDQNLKHMVSVFRNGWFSLDSRWNSPTLAKDFQVVYSLVEEIKQKIGNKPMDTLEVLLVTGSENGVYTLLQSLQADADPVELSTHSPLCEILQCANVTVCVEGSITPSGYDHTVFVDDLDIKIYVKETAYFRCERCRRYTGSHSNEPCEMCLLNMADNWAM